MTEHEFSLPDGGTWIVQAFEFPTEQKAKAVWEKIEAESKGKKRNFSIWRTTNPERTHWLVVICGRREHLPNMKGGTPFELSREEAHQFALRRARVGADAWKENAPAFEQEMRYSQPMVINPQTGEVEPYRQR
jgi:hypothetical protein